MNRSAIALAVLALCGAAPADAARDTWLRDLHLPSNMDARAPEDFAETLRDEVGDKLAACATPGLRLDLKVDDVAVRHGDFWRDGPNRLIGRLTVRQAKGHAALAVHTIDVFVPDEGYNAALLRDPAILVAEATGDMICARAFGVEGAVG